METTSQRVGWVYIDGHKYDIVVHYRNRSTTFGELSIRTRNGGVRINRFFLTDEVGRIAKCEYCTNDDMRIPPATRYEGRIICERCGYSHPSIEYINDHELLPQLPKPY